MENLNDEKKYGNQLLTGLKQQPMPLQVAQWMKYDRGYNRYNML